MKHESKLKTYAKKIDILRYGVYDQKIEDRLVDSYCELLRLNLPRSKNPNRKFDLLAEQASMMRLAIRHGFFLRVIANAEATLKLWCEIIQEYRICGIGVDDLRGGSPNKFRDYLHKVGGIGFGPANADWNNLEKLFLIRHAWAHADGLIKQGEQEKLQKFINSNAAHVSLKDSVVVIESTLVSLAADTAIKVIMHIESQFRAQSHEQRPALGK